MKRKTKESESPESPELPESNISHNYTPTISPLFIDSSSLVSPHHYNGLSFPQQPYSQAIPMHLNPNLPFNGAPIQNISPNQQSFPYPLQIKTQFPPQPIMQSSFSSLPRLKQSLSENEKRANHVESEKKRRLNIKAGFDALVEAVPTLNAGQRSEAVILQSCKI